MTPQNSDRDPASDAAPPASSFRRNRDAGPGPGSIAQLAPGLSLTAAGVCLAWAVAAQLPAVGPMVAAIVLGIAAGNLVRLPAAVEPGLAVASKRVLRIGIVVLGLRLSLHDIVNLGPGMVLTVIAVVVGGIVAGLAIGSVLGLDRRLRLLIACGFSICGAAAIAAVAGVLGGDRVNRSRARAGLEESVATAVALVVIFGTLMIPAIPALGHGLGLSGSEIGLWAGASVHEVAQVVAIGGSVGDAALGAAVVVKLGRVLLLAPVMAVLAVGERRRIRDGGGDAADGALPPVMPLFVAGFLAMVVVRSSGLVPQVLIDAAGVAEQLCLAAAMFALGAGVRFSLRRKVGAAPLLMAALTTAIVAAVGLAGVVLAA